MFDPLKHIEKPGEYLWDVELRNARLPVPLHMYKVKYRLVNLETDNIDQTEADPALHPEFDYAFELGRQRAKDMEHDEGWVWNFELEPIEVAIESCRPGWICNVPSEAQVEGGVHGLGFHDVTGEGR